MNSSKLTLLVVSLLATTPLFAAMNGSNPSNLPAPQATPTAPTSVGPNGAMRTGTSPTPTSAVPTASSSSGTTPPQANQAMGPTAPSTPSTVPPSTPSTVSPNTPSTVSPSPAANDNENMQ
jgi:hypothetical protein